LPPGPAVGTLPAPQLAAILQRADAMLALGDVLAARLLYARAAAAGSGEAMLALGKVQDPLFLEEIGVRGILGDAALAISWYRRAQARGIAEARDRLVRHRVRPEE
jgi:TPR repeat protein